MSALPHSVDVTVTRPAWLDGALRGARIAGLCCLALLVPGEAGRLGSGDLSRPS